MLQISYVIYQISLQSLHILDNLSYINLDRGIRLSFIKYVSMCTNVSVKTRNIEFCAFQLPKARNVSVCLLHLFLQLNNSGSKEMKNVVNHRFSSEIFKSGFCNKAHLTAIAVNIFLQQNWMVPSSHRTV